MFHFHKSNCSSKDDIVCVTGSICISCNSFCTFFPTLINKYQGTFQPSNIS